MKYEDLVLLLPCHSLEDFPQYHTGEDSEGLLSAWSALWHPALIHAAGKTPTWSRADNPPENMSNRLLVIPQVSESLLAAGWATRAKNEGATVVRKKHKRTEIVEAALAALDGGDAGVEPALALDFLALGFCQLQVELLIRQMRHYSNLDETHLRDQAVAAAHAAVEKDVAKAKGHLQQCFDVLCESRERCYPATAYLIDVTLVAATTLGAGLRRDLESGVPTNLLITGELLEQMAREESTSLAAVKQGIDAKNVELIGGEFTERDLPMLPLDSLAWDLARGRAAYEKHLGTSPVVYGRRRFGLTPALPQILSRSGFIGAIHFTLDDGQFPKGDQGKCRWEGLDNSAIDAWTRVPVDANDAGAFLSFPERMGETMDLDHVAAVAFAHWPGQAAVFYEDMRRMSRYAPVLGKFVTLGAFFRDTEAPGRISKWLADDYRAPYLKQSIIRRRPDVASRYAVHWSRRLTWDAGRMLATLAANLKPVGYAERGAAIADKFDALLTELEKSASPFDEPAPADLDRRLSDALAEQGRAVAALVPRKLGGDSTPGYLIVNTQSFARTVGVELPELAADPEIAGPVLASQDIAKGKAVVVELPAAGYVWVAGSDKAAKPVKMTKPMGEPNLLRNDFMEVSIDPATGGIRSIRDFRTRGNRLSQQLAFRLPTPKQKPGAVWRDPDLDAIYSEMRGESVELTANGTSFAEIATRGHLVDPDGKRLAGFAQRIRLWRGSRVVDLRITLTPEEQPKADPWNSYYAVRFAWGDATSDLFRSAGQGVTPTDAKRVEAPQFIEIRSPGVRTAILTGGLPYHRKVGMRMLDTLLLSRGDTATNYRLGIAVDADHPALEAQAFAAPVPTVADVGPAPQAVPSCWFFHVDAKNVMATSWHELVENGQVVGYRVRLLETEGKSGGVKLRSFRSVAKARQVDLLGNALATLGVEGDVVKVDITPHEWAEIEVRWS